MSTKKTPSLAATLDAQEIKYRKTKIRKTKHSVHEKELAEIAREVYFKQFRAPMNEWEHADDDFVQAWRAAVKAVLEEAIYRVEAKING